MSIKLQIQLICSNSTFSLQKISNFFHFVEKNSFLSVKSYFYYHWHSKLHRDLNKFEKLQALAELSLSFDRHHDLRNVFFFETLLQHQYLHLCKGEIYAQIDDYLKKSMPFQVEECLRLGSLLDHILYSDKSFGRTSQRSGPKKKSRKEVAEFNFCNEEFFDVDAALTNAQKIIGKILIKIVLNCLICNRIVIFI